MRGFHLGRARILALAGGLVALGVASSGGLVAAAVPGMTLPPPDSCIAPILPCSIALSIDSGSHGNRVTVTASQFWPGEPFTVYFWNGTFGAAALAVATGSTGTGSFTSDFATPNESVGNYTVFVTDLAGDNQSAGFHLTKVRSAPNAVGISGTMSLSGQGFLPNHVVRFHLHGTLATTTVPCRTNGTGAFSGCLATVPNVPVGSTRLIATDGTYTARIDFTVV